MGKLLRSLFFTIVLSSEVEMITAFRNIRGLYSLNYHVRNNRILSQRLFCHNSQHMEVSTRLWVERFVYGKGLCPWSGGALAADNMRIRTLYGGLSGTKAIEFCDEIIKEANIIKDRDLRSTGPSTTLLIVPDFKDFEEFVELIYVVEELLESERLDTHVQIAHFHPEYKFADSDGGEREGDASDYTNRSPFPTLHLIRLPDMTRAIDEYSARHGDTEGIWKRNKETMRSLGVDKIKEMQNKLLIDAEKECRGSGVDKGREEAEEEGGDGIVRGSYRSNSSSSSSRSSSTSSSSSGVNKSDNKKEDTDRDRSPKKKNRLITKYKYQNKK